MHVEVVGTGGRPARAPHDLELAIPVDIGHRDPRRPVLGIAHLPDRTARGAVVDMDLAPLTVAVQDLVATIAVHVGDQQRLDVVIAADLIFGGLQVGVVDVDVVPSACGHDLLDAIGVDVRQREVGSGSEGAEVPLGDQRGTVVLQDRSIREHDLELRIGIDVADRHVDCTQRDRAPRGVGHRIQQVDGLLGRDDEFARAVVVGVVEEDRPNRAVRNAEGPEQRAAGAVVDLQRAVLEADEDSLLSADAMHFDPRDVGRGRWARPDDFVARATGGVAGDHPGVVGEESTGARHAHHDLERSIAIEVHGNHARAADRRAPDRHAPALVESQPEGAFRAAGCSGRRHRGHRHRCLRSGCFCLTTRVQLAHAVLVANCVSRPVDLHRPPRSGRSLRGSRLGKRHQDQDRKQGSTSDHGSSFYPRIPDASRHSREIEQFSHRLARSSSLTAQPAGRW